MAYMRTIWRTHLRELDRDIIRDVALVAAATALVGVTFGAITVSAGLPVWLPVMLSVLVFSGASQFVFVGLMIAGGGPMAAVLAALLVNVRHLPFGLVVGDLLGTGPARRLAGSHLMIDEAVAFALSQDDGPRRRAAYWVTGIGLFVSWNAAVVVGAAAGTAISDTGALGLDAAFPAVLLALILPSLRAPATRRAALAGVVVALVTAPFVPTGVPVLLALAGVVVGARRARSDAPAVVRS
jgi:4-azaleucine resistance transporter AzlC